MDCVKLLQQINSVKADMGRLNGKIEHNDKVVKEAEDNLRECGYDPERLDEEITELEDKRNKKAEELQKKVDSLAADVRTGLEALS